MVVKWIIQDMATIKHMIKYRWYVSYPLVMKLQEFDKVPIDLRQKFINTIEIIPNYCTEYRAKEEKELELELEKLINEQPDIPSPARINIQGIPRLYRNISIAEEVNDNERIFNIYKN